MSKTKTTKAAKAALSSGAAADHSSSHSSTATATHDPTRRDEINELKVTFGKETKRVHTLRWIVTLALVCTALAICYFTYKNLHEEEERNFEDAVRTCTTKLSSFIIRTPKFLLIIQCSLILRYKFEQFSRTVTNAAIEQQIRIQHGLKSFENSMTSSALSTNSVWPFFVMPNFEQHARDVSVRF